MFTGKNIATLLSILFLAPLSCTRPDDSPDKKDETHAVSRAWLEKAAQKLRGGEGLSPDDDVDELLKKDKAQIIDLFMKDERFYSTVFDFNLFYLGYKSHALKNSEGIIENVIGISKGSFHSAIASTKEVAQDGDYLKLLAFESPVYAQPLLKKEATDAIFGETEEDSFEVLFRGLQGLETFLHESPRPMLRKSFCEFIQEKVGDGFLKQSLQRIVSQFSFGKFFPDFDEHPFRDSIRRICFSRRPPDEQEEFISEDSIIDLIQKIAKSRTYATYLQTLQIENYAPRSPLDFQEFRLDLTPFEGDKKQIGMEWFWLTLPNSSTNFDRKRAAYVLKRFFCDDLTPINVEQPEAHAAGNRHASDPSCQSCHYKLDPIGGFFRYTGARGRNFKGFDEIFFDDFALKSLDEYTKEWRSEDGQKWNVGYIRSLTDNSLNLTVEDNPDPDLPDLFDLMQKAPEVRKCLVKNIFKYFVGDEISLDAGYLEHLTDRFNETAEDNSTQALKETIKEVLKGRSFAQKSPRPGECYDFAPGEKMDSRPPCEIAALLEKNCTSCHSSSSLNGGLNLEKWQDVGGFVTFPHTSKNKQLSKTESFAVIAERLNTSDPEKRMPFKKHMDPVEREALFKFFSKP